MTRLFSKIDTRAVLPDGRVITASRSKPSGYTKAEYDEINAALVAAFGVRGSRTEGTYLDHQR